MITENVQIFWAELQRGEFISDADGTTVAPRGEFVLGDQWDRLATQSTKV